MGLMEKMALCQEQYARLQQLGESFLEKKAPDLDDVEYLILERERCLLTIQTDPLSTADRLNLDRLCRKNKETLTAQEQQQAELYLALKKKNHTLINQDQALNMKLRNLQKQYVDKEEDPQDKQKKQASANQAYDNQYLGRRFNRLR